MKKNRCIFFFIFPMAGIYEKKNEKKNGAGTEIGNCPNCIAIQFIVLQERGLFGWKKKIVLQWARNCIARG